MLKNIPKILSPELLKIMMEMGHNDDLVIADGNFPGASTAKRLIRLDGHNVPEVLDAVLRFFPLDYFVEKSVTLMNVNPGDNYTPTVRDSFKDIILKWEAESVGNKENAGIEYVDRFAFYEKAKNAYAVITTGERAKYANLVLKKGIVTDANRGY